MLEAVATEDRSTSGCLVMTLGTEHCQLGPFVLAIRGIPQSWSGMKETAG